MNLAFKKYGEHPVHLVILHGLFGTMDNWHTLATAFANTFTVWAIDQRNHGRSPHSDLFDYNVMADDLYDFMAQQNIPMANIIGHSMGGKTAMQFSFRHPDKINRLIIADIAPKAYGPSHNELIDALHGLDLSRINRRVDADEMLSEKIADPGVRQFLLKNLTREGESYKWKMNLEGITKNYDAVIGEVDEKGRFDKPTLFIRGGHSDYITSDDEARISRQFPASKIVTLESAGHWVHAEAPQQFLDTALIFLNKE